MRLYVNGKQVASDRLQGTAVVSNGALRIGGNKVWAEWFKGAIDDVRVYSRALSAAEIGADMAAPAAAATLARAEQTAVKRGAAKQVKRDRRKSQGRKRAHRPRWL